MRLPLTFALFLVLTLFAASVSAASIDELKLQTERSGGHFLPENSFSLPIGTRSFVTEVPNWTFGGTALLTDKFVRLTPDRADRNGWIWNKMPLICQSCYPDQAEMSWQIEIEFAVGGKGASLYGDGFAFWVVEQPGIAGPVFGSNEQFKGLGIFYDTYDNDQDGNNPYVVAMLNDGTKSYDGSVDGTTHQLTRGCRSFFRNVGYNTRSRITYIHRTLTVEMDVSKNGGTWTQCFTADNVDIPQGYFIGLSAHTGQVADNHDIVSVQTTDLSRQIHDEARYATNFHSVKAEYKSNTWLYLILGLAIFAVAAVALVFGFNILGEARTKRSNGPILSPYHR